jgi:hypothetical protein
MGACHRDAKQRELRALPALVTLASRRASMAHAFIRLATSLSTASALWLCGATASAQVSDAIYGDIKSTVEELLTREVAESVVPQLACRGSNEDPEKLGQVMGRPDDDVVTIENKRYRLLVLSHFPRTLHGVYSRQFGTLRQTVREEAAWLAAYFVHRALTTSDGAQSDQKADSTLDHRFSSAELAACVAAVGAAFQRGTFARAAVPVTDAVCTEDAARDQRFACNSAKSTAAALMGKPAVAEDYLIRAAGNVATERILERHPQAKDREALEDALLLTLRTLLAHGPDAWPRLADRLGPLPAPAAVPPAAAPVAPALPAPAPGGAQPAAPVPAAAGPSPAGQLLGEFAPALLRLAEQWRASTSEAGGRMDIYAFMHIIAGKGGALSALCDQPEPRSNTELCGVLREIPRMPRDLTRGSFWPVLRMASRASARDAAHMGVSALFPRDQATAEDCERDHELCRMDMYRRFATSFATYTIDTLEDSRPPSDATRAALRSAATDVVHELAAGGGIDRSFAGTFFVPDVALRASWNAAYVSDSGSSFRYIASVDWLTLRARVLYTDMAYTAFHFSLVDAVAPLAELATRDNRIASYVHTERLALNLVTPRLDAVFGVPAFSKHFLVGAGISLRMCAPLTTGDRLPDGSEKFEYRFVWDDREQIPRFIEFGFLAKYKI